MQSYGHGLAALKLTAKDTGLTIDNVDETMAELSDVINDNIILFFIILFYLYYSVLGYKRTQRYTIGNE